ncbi:hypothetical protein OQ968_12850 [Mycobacterium sp. 663a-19]|uniref:hypothetical protein n=1 Tax=Mycobacterium sp. 663a-19 TaxID=2986148 RepID=UPI002D1E59F1|nr:hypothetical protein [Mycobacterium sp. 663a-19]MEB3982152.1 hypothetical protein [Mycobacterium sp. 663a-19]
MHPFAEALADKSLDDLLACVSAEVTYHSPVMRNPVRGAVVADILAILLDAVDDLTIREEFGESSTAVLICGLTVQGVRGEAAWVLRFDRTGKVRELTWQARPFAVAVRLSEAFGGGLARRRGGVFPAIVLAGRPLARLVAWMVDLLAPHLVR